MVWSSCTGILGEHFRRVATLRRGDSTLRKRRRQGLGVSPVISSTILIAITVTLGLSLWSFVTSQVNTSTESFASATTDYVNYVNERYVIVSMAFRYDDPAINKCSNDSKCITIWIYNYSERDVRIKDVLFGDSTKKELINEVYFETKEENNVLKANTLGSLSVDLTGLTDLKVDFTGDGKTVYYTTVMTEGGATKVYYQTDK